MMGSEEEERVNDRPVANDRAKVDLKNEEIKNKFKSSISIIVVQSGEKRLRSK